MFVFFALFYFFNKKMISTMYDLSTLRQKFAPRGFCTNSAIEKECENQINHNT